MRRCFISIMMILFPAWLSFGEEIDENTLECTSVVVGRLASADGSVITSHTCDGVSHSWVSYVPAADHKRGETTPLRKNWRKTRYADDTLGIQVVGYIPQVRHTYAYLNTGYPSLNEKQVGIGETTFSGPDTLREGSNPLVIEELCRLALERCDNARDAIRTMGAIAEEYGYADGGECLTVADTKEVWFFEITGAGRGVKSAVWVAKRVPDDEISISANIPRIGRMERENSNYFMASDNVEQVAKGLGLWDGEGEFVYWKVYKADYAKGKNFREREFHLFNTLAPSLGLDFNAPEIPFSVKPDSLVSARRVVEMLRDTYEGTSFDMTKDLKVKDKSGNVVKSPVANPWMTTQTRELLNGVAPGCVEFTRTLAVAWCSYSTVIQLRGWLPDEIGGVCWFAVDNPGQSPHIPLFAGGTTLPDAFYRCGHKGYYPDCVLWEFRKANKLATLSWQTTKDGFMEDLTAQEDLTFGAMPALEKSYLSAPKAERGKILDDFTAEVHSRLAAKWQELEIRYWRQFGRGF